MRTLNDIIPPSRRKEPSVLEESPMSIGRRARFPYGMFLTIVLVIAVGICALLYFSRAEVDVTPNTVSAAVQSSFIADQSKGDLPFEVVTAQKVASQSVAAAGSKSVTSAASGTITIYNTQDKAQRLVANTRFATVSGLIFRIHSAVTVPGGSSAKPGSVTATAYADQNGDSYNVGPTSFTLPGLAGTPLASQVYARSSVAMAGGASGTVPIVDPAAEAKARDALITALQADLVTSIQTQVPSGYVLIPGAATTTFSALASAPSATTGMADVKEQGTMTAVVFPNAALAKAIAESVTGLGYTGEPLTLTSVDGLRLSTSQLPDGNTATFPFLISGTAALEYTVNPEHIAAAVAGGTRSAAEVALTNYPEVKRAVIILRPFWRQTFPQDPASISVVVEGAH